MASDIRRIYVYDDFSSSELLFAGCLYVTFLRGSDVIKHIRPACGSVRYTRKEIDEQANSPESVWIYGYDIYVAPKILIGTNMGMTAVEYKDIKQLYFQEKWHREAIRGSKRITLSGRETHSYRDAFTYRLIVVTHNRRLIMCDSMSGDGAALKNISMKSAAPVSGDRTKNHFSNMSLPRILCESSNHQCEQEFRTAGIYLHTSRETGEKIFRPEESVLYN